MAPRRFLNALIAAAALAGAAAAQSPAPGATPPATTGQGPAAPGPAAPAIESLLEDLRAPGQENWARIEARIWREWSRSGSAAMDLLLSRGRDAIEAGEIDAAVEHLTALTDHAPGFAEGWNARATAHYLRGAYGPALDDLQTALALEPRHFGALVALGIILEDVGRKPEAREAYRAALAIHPHLEAAQAGLARLERALAGEAI